MKLVEILARELKEWPEGANFASNSYIEKSRMVFFYGCGGEYDREFSIRTSANVVEQVTRAQWEAERARIASNQQATQEAREIARTGSMTSEEQELAAIACGKRSKEDQELWDKVAVAVIGGVVSSDAFHNYPNFQGDPEVGAVFASQMADAFMAERAKRMK